MTERLFHVTEKGSTVRTELLAGLTTFMTMAYILAVNSGMFAELPGVSYYAIYIATALSAAIGTLYGACTRGNLLTPEGEVPNMERAMLADAVATVCGAVCGTSTVSSYVEASAGIAEGGKTGLAALVTGALP